MFNLVDLSSPLLREVVDIATLTGACMVALGKDITGWAMTSLLMILSSEYDWCCIATFKWLADRSYSCSVYSGYSIYKIIYVSTYT